jgi:putative serine protease PepD
MSQTRTQQMTDETGAQPAQPALPAQPVEQTAAQPTIHWYGLAPDQPVPPSSGPSSEPPTSGLPPAGPPVEQVGGADPRRPGRRRWLDPVVAAVVAAVVAGGTTAGVLAADHDPARASTTSSSSRSGQDAAGTGQGPVAQAAGQAVDWSKVAKAVEPSVVAISTRSQFSGSEGSGVVLDTKGHVLTNNHVVAGVTQGGSLTVTLSDGRSYDATIVGTDPSTDLAVIAMKGATDLQPATLGDSDAVAVGAPVMAVGNPLGLAGTVTTGIVSALDRPVTTSNESTGDSAASGDSLVVTNAIQTDAAVNPGNSGGALVDTSGRVIGIPSSIASLGQSAMGSQAGSIGLGFSIPINEAKSIADQLMADGTVEHPFLGISLKDGTVEQGAAHRAAALVTDVSAGSPAQTAGLRAGDAVLAVDGESVNSSESLVAQIRERSVGDTVELTIMRGGKQQKLTATLTKRSAG